ncbi:MAG: Hsp33 family molecular chaperone HslO [Clostridia bacterium]|nr:Hsp33 family molecular chaperone HslO [Clostridia bacterium]
MSNCKSYIVRAMTSDGSARIIFADATEIVSKAAKIHQTSKTCTAALGRSLCACSLIGSLLKNESDTVTLQINGGGPAGKVICVSDYKGNVRGTIDNPSIEIGPNDKGKLDVGGVIGNEGSLYVIRDLGFGEPYIGSTPLVSGEIGDDISEYFARSEQTPTVCALGVRVNTDKTVKSAGGILLQLMPGADETIIPTIERNISTLGSVSAHIANGRSGEDIIADALRDIPFDIFDKYDIDYTCSCNKDKYQKALATLSDDDFASVIADNKPVEAVCHFCKKKYTFTVDELVNARKKAKE